MTLIYFTIDGNTLTSFVKCKVCVEFEERDEHHEARVADDDESVSANLVFGQKTDDAFVRVFQVQVELEGEQDGVGDQESQEDDTSKLFLQANVEVLHKDCQDLLVIFAYLQSVRVVS